MSCCRLFVVFVSSKSCIYITPTSTAATSALLNVSAPQIGCCDKCTAAIVDKEPIYENIENGNIVPSGDNKFTIYVNYDEIVGEKGKSSVRVLEPDVQIIQRNTKEFHDQLRQIGGDDVSRRDCIAYEHDDDDLENENSSKMIQCQQISMYIGEKNMIKNEK